MSKSQESKYELMLIIDSTIGSDAVKKRVEKTKKLLSSSGAELFDYEELGEKALAYRMKTNAGAYKDNGFYSVFYFTMKDTKAVKEIESTIRLENEVIRHLLIKLPFSFDVSKMKEEQAKVAALMEEEKKKKEKKPE